MKKTIVMILRSIDVNRGGVTKATIKRANLLSEKYKDVIILTTLFQQNHIETMRKLFKTELSKKVKVYNFFEYYRNLPSKKLFKTKYKYTIEEKESVAVRVKHHAGYSYRYYKDGLYTTYKRFDEKKRIVFIDVRKDGIARTKRKEFDVHGNLVRERHIDVITNHPAFDQYYDRNNECFLSVHFNPNTKKDWSVVHFNDKKARSYRNLREMQNEWIKIMIENFKNPIVIGEQRQFDPVIVELPKHVKKVIMVHSNHLLKPFNNRQEVDKPYVRLFNWFDDIDKLVLLTEEQRDDIENITGKTNKINVIPHAYNKPKESDKRIERDPLKVVVVARYVEDKRIDNIITAFKKVTEELPEATLDIYGKGPLKNELNKLIKSLKLNKSVKLKGYTNNPHHKYQEAACSVIISLREGFGMVITESLSAGTPVVAYDFKYGPKDIIKNNENGIIVENGNTDELADAIIKILSNKELQNKMSESALEVKNDFSEEKYRKSWLKLIKEI